MTATSGNSSRRRRRSEAVEPRHLDVENHDVRGCRRHAFEALDAVARRRHREPIRLEQVGGDAPTSSSSSITTTLGLWVSDIPVLRPGYRTGGHGSLAELGTARGCPKVQPPLASRGQAQGNRAFGQPARIRLQDEPRRADSDDRARSLLLNGRPRMSGKRPPQRRGHARGSTASVNAVTPFGMAGVLRGSRARERGVTSAIRSGKLVIVGTPSSQAIRSAISGRAPAGPGP